MSTLRNGKVYRNPPAAVFDTTYFEDVSGFSRSNWNALSVTSGGLMTCLNLALGPSTRTNKGLSLNIWHQGSKNCRGILLFDSQCNGAFPTTAALYENPTSKLFLDHVSYANRARFSVIDDFWLPEGNHMLFSRFYSLLNTRTTYSDNGILISSVLTNSLLLVLISEANITVNYNARLIYM